MKTLLKGFKFNPETTKEIPIVFLEDLNKKYNKGYYFGLENLFKGVWLEDGWQFNLKPFYKRILVKQYGSWQEYKAPNKTSLRRALYGKIQEMHYIG